MEDIKVEAITKAEEVMAEVTVEASEAEEITEVAVIVVAIKVVAEAASQQALKYLREE